MNDTIVTAESELGGIARQIGEHSEAITSIAQGLFNHANRLHGSQPESETTSDAPNYPDTAMGKIYEALNRLHLAGMFLDQQARRNTNIA